MNDLKSIQEKTRFGSLVFGMATFWETCTSVVKHEDKDS